MANGIDYTNPQQALLDVNQPIPGTIPAIAQQGSPEWYQGRQQQMVQQNRRQRLDEMTAQQIPAIEQQQQIVQQRGIEQAHELNMQREAQAHEQQMQQSQQQHEAATQAQQLQAQGDLELQKQIAATQLTPYGKLGTGGKIARIAEDIGGVIAPRFTSRIPGSPMNIEARQQQLQSQLAERQKAEADLTEAQARMMTAQREAKGTPEWTDQGLITIDPTTNQANPVLLNGKPVTKADKDKYQVVEGEDGTQYAVDLQAGTASPLRLASGEPLTSAPKGAQKIEGKVDYDSGIPVAIHDRQGTAYTINPQDLSNIPQELRSEAQRALEAHREHESEADQRAADTASRTLSRELTLFQAHQDAPTAQERMAQDRALIAAQAIPGIVQQVKDHRNELGPVLGRWNDYMQGKIGLKGDLAGLRTNLNMLANAVAMAHAVGRLPENLREDFERMIYAPQQDPDNLLATLQAVQPWMQNMSQVAAIGRGKTPGVPVGSPTGGAAPKEGAYRRNPQTQRVEQFRGGTWQ